MQNNLSLKKSKNFFSEHKKNNFSVSLWSESNNLEKITTVSSKE